jgi:MarR family 2-MHQ and catechol resistance regulon transcriptional repressor
VGTHYDGTAAEVRALDAFIALFRAADTVGKRTSQMIQTYDLTTAQFGVLETLLHLGPMEQVRLASKQLVSCGNITFVVDRLERAGLVERVASRTDRRCKRVRLTRRGRALISRIFPAQVAFMVQAMTVLTSAEQASLGRLCRKLGLGNQKIKSREKQ